MVRTGPTSAPIDDLIVNGYQNVSVIRRTCFRSCALVIRVFAFGYSPDPCRFLNPATCVCVRLTAWLEISDKSSTAEPSETSKRYRTVSPTDLLSSLGHAMNAETNC